MKHIVQFTFITLLISGNAFSQFKYVKDWDHRYGGNADDKLETFHQTSDKGFILGGTSYSDSSGDKNDYNRGGSDYWVVKTDSVGVMQWNKTFGGPHFDDLKEVIETSDGGFVLGGSSRSGIGGDKTEPNWDASSSTPTHDYWIVKTDPLGNKLWDKRFGGIYEDVFTCIRQTKDNGFIIGGYSDGNATGDRTENSRGGPDFWIIKTDESGTKQWDKRFGGNRNDQLWAMQQSTDGGYILGGFSWSDSTGDKTVNNWGLVNYCDYWVVKIDSLGNKQWDNHYGGINNEYLNSIEQTRDGGYIMGGPSWSDSTADKTSHNRGPSNTSDYWIVKTNSNGILQWENSFGGINHEDEYGNTIQTNDDGYLVSGTSYSQISGNKTEQNMGQEQTWVVKTDLFGNILWDKTIFTSGHDEKGLAIQTADGGYAIANYTNGGVGGYKSENNWDATNLSYDYWLVKFIDSTLIHPLANFFTIDRSVCPNSCINYMNLSQNATSYQWIFDGAVPSSSTDASPQNICYNTPGVYDVTLISMKGNETNTKTFHSYIQVFQPLHILTVVQSNDTLYAPDVFSSYQWYMNGQPVQGGNDFFLVINHGAIYNVYATDANGCNTSSEINATISSIDNINSGNQLISIFPNPASETFSISYTKSKATELKITLVNSLGQEVYNKEINLLHGSNNIEIPIQSFPNGIYYLNLSDNDRTIKKPVTIIH